MKKGVYVQYGCGLSSPKEWINFDSSPTLRIQKNFILGPIFKAFSPLVFPENILYGDIVKGLKIKEESCDGLYCSHVLEHLAYYDLLIALKNSYKILKPGGIFRMVLPDLEFLCKKYVSDLKEAKTDASFSFMSDSLLGVEKRNTSFVSFLKSFYGNSKHLWMWDFYSLESALSKTGFQGIRKCSFNDCIDNTFNFVEDKQRFINCLAIEAIK